MNLAALLEARATDAGFDPRPAFTVGTADASATLTHREVHAGSARAATALAGLGVGRDDVVLLVLRDGFAFVWAFLGAVRLGALAVPVNPQLTEADHRFLVEDSGAVAVVCEADLASRFADGPPSMTAEEVARAATTLAPHPVVTVQSTQGAYAQYTSGTTGVPKAAVHRHGDPLVYHRACASGALGIHSGDVVLSVSRMFFAYGLGNSLFFPLLSGARAVLHTGRPRPADIEALIAQHGVTVLFAVPTFYAGLFAECSPGPFVSMRIAVSAGEILTEGLAERAREFFGFALLDGLGSTEVGQTFASNTIEVVRPGTVGRCLAPYRVAVRDDAGRDLPAGTVGALWVRGPTVLVEYLGRPAETTAAFDGDWLRTGDLASVDRDGFVHLKGRADDMEMVGGISVAPREIEDLLSGHPAVTEVAVAGVRDGDGASRLRAFVVTHRAATDTDAMAAELLSLARDRLAPYKVPRSVTVVDALPRTPTGKLRRFMLRSGAFGP